MHTLMLFPIEFIYCQLFYSTLEQYCLRHSEVTIKGISALESIALKLLIFFKEQGKTIYSSTKYLLIVYYVLGNILCVGNSAMNKSGSISCSNGAYLPTEEEYGKLYKQVRKTD